MFKSVVPQFTVPDLVKTTEHYRDKLGFTIASFWDGERMVDTAERPVYFAIVRRDDVRIYFNQVDHEEPEKTSRPQAGFNAYFHVTDVDALHADLRARGADIVEKPADRGYGQREMWVRDCNGLMLAFAQEC